VDLNGSLITKKVITVSGSHKGVGKTALSEILLSTLPHFTAIKITMTSRDIGLYDNEEHLMIADTDTFRMKKSGADKVLWIRTTEDEMTDLMLKALERVGDTHRLLIEGNSILQYINPTLDCFVTTATIDNMKTSRIHALEKADLCVLNLMDNGSDKSLLAGKIKRVNPSIEIFSFNLINNSHRTGTEFKRFVSFVQDCVN
jgi:predicted GTPase